MNWLLNFVKKQFSNTEVKQKIGIFPCQDCLLITSCTKLCNKIEMDDEKIYKKMIEYKCCPDCGGIKLIKGSCGGTSQNVMCAKCKHRFNIIGDFWDVQRICI